MSLDIPPEDEEEAAGLMKHFNLVVAGGGRRNAAAAQKKTPGQAGRLARAPGAGPDDGPGRRQARWAVGLRAAAPGAGARAAHRSAPLAGPRDDPDRDRGVLPDPHRLAGARRLDAAVRHRQAAGVAGQQRQSRYRGQRYRLKLC